MTLYQSILIDEAMDMWRRGFQIPIDLFAKMLHAGLDVDGLEAKHLNKE